MLNRFRLAESLVILTITTISFPHQIDSWRQKVNSNQIRFESKDKVNLTLPWWGTVEVNLFNLKRLLNRNLSPGKFLLKESVFLLTAKDGTVIKSVSDFDTGTLRFLLGNEGVFFNKIKFSTSNIHPYANYITAYYNYPILKKEDVKVISRFNWKGIDMKKFWTNNIKVSFQLFF